MSASARARPRPRPGSTPTTNRTPSPSPPPPTARTCSSGWTDGASDSDGLDDEQLDHAVEEGVDRGLAVAARAAPALEDGEPHGVGLHRLAHRERLLDLEA